MNHEAESAGSKLYKWSIGWVVGGKRLGGSDGKHGICLNNYFLSLLVCCIIPTVCISYSPVMSLLFSLVDVEMILFSRRTHK